MRSLRVSVLFIFFVVALSSCKQENKEHPGDTMNTPASNEKKDPRFESGYAAINGITMYYEIHGEGKPLVLIHGGGSTIGTNFSKLIPYFEQTRKVIAVELQAHGHTSDRDAPESFEQDADDVAALLEFLKISKADILGFSNGGSTAIQVAIRHQERVNKIIPISAIISRNGMQPWFWGFMEKGTFNDMPQVYKDAFLKITGDQDKLMNMYTKDRERMLSFKDWKEEDVRSIKAPVLLVVGDKDVVRAGHAFDIAELLRQASVAIIPGNHGDFIGEAMSANPNSKIPEATFLMIEEFLKD